MLILLFIFILAQFWLRGIESSSLPPRDSGYRHSQMPKVDGCPKEICGNLFEQVASTLMEGADPCAARVLAYAIIHLAKVNSELQANTRMQLIVAANYLSDAGNNILSNVRNDADQKLLCSPTRSPTNPEIQIRFLKRNLANPPIKHIRRKKVTELASPHQLSEVALKEESEPFYPKAAFPNSNLGNSINGLQPVGQMEAHQTNFAGDNFSPSELAADIDKSLKFPSEAVDSAPSSPTLVNELNTLPDQNPSSATTLRLGQPSTIKLDTEPASAVENDGKIAAPMVANATINGVDTMNGTAAVNTVQLEKKTGKSLSDIVARSISDTKDNSVRVALDREINETTVDVNVKNARILATEDSSESEDVFESNGKFNSINEISGLPKIDQNTNSTVETKTPLENEPSNNDQTSETNIDPALGTNNDPPLEANNDPALKTNNDPALETKTDPNLETKIDPALETKNDPNLETNNDLTNPSEAEITPTTNGEENPKNTTGLGQERFAKKPVKLFGGGPPKGSERNSAQLEKPKVRKKGNGRNQKKFPGIKTKKKKKKKSKLKKKK